MEEHSQEYWDGYHAALHDAVVAMLEHKSHSYGMIQYELVNIVANLPKTEVPPK